MFEMRRLRVDEQTRRHRKCRPLGFFRQPGNAGTDLRLGQLFDEQGAAPILIKIPNGPPGLYKARVTAIDVPAAGEAYSLTFATDAECTDGNVDTGTVVRWTMSNSQIAKTLAQSGATGITLRVQGTSPTSARVEYYSNIGGMPLSWTIVFYSASPNLGGVITKVAVRGINLTTRTTSALMSRLRRDQDRHRQNVHQRPDLCLDQCQGQTWTIHGRTSHRRAAYATNQPPRLTTGV